MKNYWKLTFLLALLLGGCCTEEEETLPRTIDKQPFRFSANVVNVTPVKTFYGFFQAGDSIGIYMFNTDSILSASSIMDGVDNYLYKALNLSSNPEFVPISTDTIFYPTPAIPAFIAYSPGRATINDFLLPVDVGSQPSATSIVDLDVLYSNNVTNQTSLAVEFVFNHMLSYINVEVDAGSGLTSTDLENITVVIKNIGTTANLNLVNGSFEDIASPVDTILLPGKYYPTNGAAIFEGLIVPGSNGSTSQIEFNLANNKKFIYHIPAEQVYEGGYFYNYIFTLSSTSAVVSATINSWKIGELPNGGVITVQ